MIVAKQTNSAPVGGAISSTNPYNTSGFWERLWRTSGVHAVVFFLIAYVVFAYQPGAAAPADALAAFYGAHHARILIAAVISALAALNLMWFAAALRTTLADAGRDGWGGAATSASAALAALVFVLVMGWATLAYSAPDTGSETPISTLHVLTWSGVVLSSFPRAMLIMAGTFGLWRATLISNRAFAAGLAALVLVLLGGTTWMSGGFWAPDGAYSRFISPAISVLWVLAASRILLKQKAGLRAQW
jgi:hypothetical protein